MYQYLIRDGNEQFQDATPAYQHLKEKLTNHFGERIRLEKCDTIRGTLVFSASISATEAIRKHSISENSVQSRNIALALREDIMRSEYTPLPENITIEDITKGEVTVPESVKEFLPIFDCWA